MTDASKSNGIEGYTFVETLGCGQFAVVKLARHDLSGAQVAIKVIDKTKLSETDRKHLFREVSCMRLVQHPSVIRLYEVFDTPTKLFLVLELGENGDLYDYITKHAEGVGEDESRDLFKQMVEAVSYCHMLHVVHRDLKPENVVFCQNATRVKVTDFGLSTLFAPGENLKTSCGSLSYAAPEVLLGDDYDAPAVDIWSLGVILFMLLTGEKPFAGGTDSETLAKIMDCSFSLPRHLSPESKDLVEKMLVADPKCRISIDSIANHAWMKQYTRGSSGREDMSNVRDQLGDDMHRSIVEQLVEKGAASSPDSIECALTENVYSHKSASYHLMAAIHLQKKKTEKEEEEGSDDLVDKMNQERLGRRRQHVRRRSNPSSFGDLKELQRLSISPPMPSGRAVSEPSSPDGSHIASYVNQHPSPSPRRKYFPVLAPIRFTEGDNLSTSEFPVRRSMSPIQFNIRRLPGL